MNEWFRSLTYTFAPSPFLAVAIFFLFGLFWLLYQYFRKQKRRKMSGTVKYSSFTHLKQIRPGLRVLFHHAPFFLRLGALFFLIVALARPQRGKEGSEIHTEGINILFVIDRSSSMLARDFTLQEKPADRLEVVKDVVQKFINRRQSDAMGLVVFAGYADLQCPLTLDYNILTSLTKNISIVDPNSSEDGTAIGDALGLGVLRLKEVEAKSKIIILLTDGQNTAGELTPLKAAELAKKYQIKIFTIGAGTKGSAPFPVRDFFGERLVPMAVNIDEETLTKMAQMTDGKYFRATDTKSLEEIYLLIDQMTKNVHKRNVFTEYTELFHYFVWIALLFLFLEVFLKNTFLRKLP